MTRRRFQRKVGNRGAIKQAFLIVCGGEKTEPNYFEGFPISSVHVEIIGMRRDPISVVNATIRMRKQAIREDMGYDQVWCVFDKDDFLIQDFNLAIQKAQQNKIRVAYSNQAFELWYLLHFNYFDAALSRNAYIQKLDQYLASFGGYKKNDQNIYNKLIEKQQDAIRNSQRLLSCYDPSNPGRDDPSTTVHYLVEELNRFI